MRSPSQRVVHSAWPRTGAPRPSNRVAAAPIAGLALVLGGCMLQNASPATSLQDSVYTLNDAARWSRVDIAAEEVLPVYRMRFAASRHAWGRSVQIADSEIISVAMDDGGATSVVAVSWYRVDSMTIRQTVVEQRWHRDGRDFRLEEEVISEGDPDLLAGVRVELPEAPAEDTPVVASES